MLTPSYSQIAVTAIGIRQLLGLGIGGLDDDLASIGEPQLELLSRLRRKAGDVSMGTTNSQSH